MPRPVHVMVAILRDRTGRILITSRPRGKHHAGRWEFPGGKVEDRESPEACLRRELLEELGVVAGPMQRLIIVRHDYGDFQVMLDVREVEHFGGQPCGLEGQALKWVMPEKLPAEDILEADRPIIQALRLPGKCLVTPDASACSPSEFLDGLRASLEEGIRLVQFRSPALSHADYLSLAYPVVEICREFRARLVLNAPPSILTEVDADGVHLTSARLMRLSTRAVSSDKWLSASCHSRTQLEHAQRIGVDFVFLSPVHATPTHPDALPIGWAGFAALADRAGLPVYALGGMRAADVAQARAAGGRGVAGIRSFWKGKALR